MINYGVMLSFMAGLVLVLGQATPQVVPPPVRQPAISQNPTPEPEPGQVVANDETAFSPPRQDTRDAPVPQPSVIAAKKSAGPREVRLVTINNKQYPLRTYKPLALPNDPSANQWWVSNAKLEQTWEVPRGSRQTVLAIIDTGFALRHEEFSNRWYVNAGESGPATSEAASIRNCSARGLALDAGCNLIDEDGDTVVDNESGAVTYENPSRLNCTDQLKPLTKDCNRIDDDSNGYVDDVNGWDFINFDNSVAAGELNPSGSGTTHGTLVTGVAAATGNNAKGIAGVDWGTKVLPIQALDDDSYGDTLSVGRAIFYAVQQGADVISLSLGSDLPDEYIEEAVRAATAAGSVVVAAAGNDGCDCLVYPANYPEVLAVGALNISSQLASFSSWGSNVDIVAPGTQMATTTWSASNQISAYASSVNGTSFATPLVAGLITRLLSHQPSATPLQLIAAVTENTNRLSLTAAAPHDVKLGFGAADAHKATLRMTQVRTTNQLPAFTPVSIGNYLTPLQPMEKIAPYRVHHCEQGIGSTPIYGLVKNSSRFFTVSRVETNRAKELGYSASFLAYGCLQQPHDTAAAIRNIDLFHEFRNIYRAQQ